MRKRENLKKKYDEKEKKEKQAQDRRQARNKLFEDKRKASIPEKPDLKGVVGKLYGFSVSPEVVCTMLCSRCKQPKSKREFADVPKTRHLYCAVCQTRTEFIRELV